MTIHVRQGNRKRRETAQTSTGPGLRMGMGMLLLVTMTALFYAYTSARALEVSYEVSRELNLKRELMEDGRRLKVELNSLKSPHRLERAARRMSLAAPGPGQLRRMP